MFETDFIMRSDADDVSIGCLEKRLSTALRVEAESERVANDPPILNVYQPLNKDRNEIRVLILEAGTGSSVLQCRLEQAFLNLRQKPRYETISYCVSILLDVFSN